MRSDKQNPFRMSHLKVESNLLAHQVFAPTMSQLKLAIAMELRAEGFYKVVFDEVVEDGGRKVRVHVLGDDEVGLRLAVICINRADRLVVGSLADDVEAVQRALGEDCEVTIAIPITLLDKAGEIFGITSRIFLLDTEYRVWTHACDSAYTKMVKKVMLSECQDDPPEVNEDLQAKPCRRWQTIEYVI